MFYSGLYWCWSDQRINYCKSLQSLKKEVEWDRNVGDDRSTTGESSSDYRHPHEPVSRHISPYVFSFGGCGLLANDNMWFKYIDSFRWNIPLKGIYTAHITCVPVAVARAVWGVGLRPLACWDRGFESHRGHGCLFVVSVVCCQVEVSATSWSLVQKSPTDCRASLCVI